MPRKKTAPKVTKPRGKRGFMVKKRKDPKFVTMTLNIKHTRNGQVYGPAVNAEVPFDLVREFQYEEQCDREAEERFQGNRAMIVLSRGRVRQIPVEAFDSGYVGEFDNPSHRT